MRYARDPRVLSVCLTKQRSVETLKLQFVIIVIVRVVYC